MRNPCSDQEWSLLRELICVSVWLPTSCAIPAHQSEEDLVVVHVVVPRYMDVEEGLFPGARIGICTRTPRTVLFLAPINLQPNHLRIYIGVLQFCIPDYLSHSLIYVLFILFLSVNLILGEYSVSLNIFLLWVRLRIIAYLADLFWIFFWRFAILVYSHSFICLRE